MQRKQVTRQSLRTVAYHEAGHAVADIRFDFAFDRVTIIPSESDGTLGHAKSVYGADDEHQVIDYLAGYAAEIEVDPESKAQAKLGASDDFDRARDCLRRLGVKCRLDPWHRKAHRFVRDNWHAIDMIARDLVELKTLDGDEVALIVNIADGEPDATEALAKHRAYFLGRKGTQQFPFTVKQPLEE
jgi:ATP-dependent Zn protease